jgi:hypothetical protein
LGASAPNRAPQTAQERQYSNVVPDVHPDIMGQVFYLTDHEPYNEYRRANPEVFSGLGLNSGQTRWILNFVNGARSVTEIRNRTAAMAGDEITLEQVVTYLEILEAVGWIVVDGEL